MSIRSRRLRLSLLLSLLPSCRPLQLIMSKGMADVANFAVRQSPATTTFVTNKMCPFAQKAWIALELVNAPYEMKEVSLYGAGGKPDWFWELNPAGTVPVLECYGGAMVLPDSDLILDQIADGVVEGGSALKPDNEETQELVTKWRDHLAKLIPVGKNAVLGGGRKKVIELLQRMDGNVVGPYLCGEKVTVADCALFPFVWRLNDEFGPLKKQGCTKIGAWLEKCGQTKAFSKTIQSSWWWWW